MTYRHCYHTRVWKNNWHVFDINEHQSITFVLYVYSVRKRISLLRKNRIHWMLFFKWDKIPFHTMAVSHVSELLNISPEYTNTKNRYINNGVTIIFIPPTKKKTKKKQLLISFTTRNRAMFLINHKKYLKQLLFWRK